jgi:uncharacterized membrane protein YkgB
MNSLVTFLGKLGVLKKDFDYHLLRASMVVIFLFFWHQKWFQYEAQALIPYISHGPLIFGCIQFSAFAVPPISWASRSGCLGRYCSRDSGTKS